MKRLFGYFLRGLIITAPAAVTVWVCVSIFQTVDGWLGIRIPGVGFFVTLLLITAVGVLGSSLVTAHAVSVFEELLERLPFVRLLYSSTKDLMSAFVGEKKGFSQPVLVALGMDAEVKLLGFLTQPSVEKLHVLESVVVYVPHSYAWSGQMLIVPSSRITLMKAESAEIMAFVVSGGVMDFPKID
jgi:uncharacterized membrane protein